MNKKKGFTLIELLVVVAIIGLLSTLSIVALNSARAKSRDARRVSDVKQIQTALELYYNDFGQYPASSSDLVPNYMGMVPTPPTPTNDGGCDAGVTTYAYTADSNNRSYSLVYCLGAPTGGLASGTGIATPAGIK